MTESGLHLLGCAVLYNEYMEMERNRRGMIREFKRRHNGKYTTRNMTRLNAFKLYHIHYERARDYLYSDNIWYEYLDINKEYFIRLMEEKNRDYAADR